MGNIIKIGKPVLSVKDTFYNLPTKEIISAIIDLLHGTGNNFCQISAYSYDDGKNIAHDPGKLAHTTPDSILSKEDLREVYISISLKACMIAMQIHDTIKEDQYYFHDEPNTHIVFVAGEDAFYSFAWFQSKRLIQGASFATLLAYSFGHINNALDEDTRARLMDLAYSDRIHGITAFEIGIKISAANMGVESPIS